MICVWHLSKTSILIFCSYYFQVCKEYRGQVSKLYPPLTVDEVQPDRDGARIGGPATVVPALAAPDAIQGQLRHVVRALEDGRVGAGAIVRHDDRGRRPVGAGVRTAGGWDQIEGGVQAGLGLRHQATRTVVPIVVYT